MFFMYSSQKISLGIGVADVWYIVHERHDIYEMINNLFKTAKTDEELSRALAIMERDARKKDQTIYDEIATQVADYMTALYAKKWVAEMRYAKVNKNVSE